MSFFENTMMNYINSKLEIITTTILRTGRKLDRYFIIGMMGITAVITYITITREKVKDIEKKMQQLEEKMYEKLHQIPKEPPVINMDVIRELVNSPKTRPSPTTSYPFHSPSPTIQHPRYLLPYDDHFTIQSSFEDHEENTQKSNNKTEDKSTNTYELWYCMDYGEYPPYNKHTNTPNESQTPSQSQPNSPKKELLVDDFIMTQIPRVQSSTITPSILEYFTMPN